MKRFLGFTLIETMVAISILTLAIVGPMITANRTIVAAETARDQLTASYLAQEGIEYVRAVRDDNFLASYPGNTVDAWTNFRNDILVKKCSAPDSCELGGRVNDADPEPKLCTGDNGTCPSPFSLVTNGTAFTRTIQMFDGTNEERVVVRVSWSFHSTPYSVTITDHLTPWQ